MVTLLLNGGAYVPKLGHPEPFGMAYIGIGNEEVGEPFFERYPLISIERLRRNIRISKSLTPLVRLRPEVSMNAGGNPQEREHKSDLVDEHYYQSPEWFLAHYHRYDDFKADDPKVFLGEYASTWKYVL